MGERRKGRKGKVNNTETRCRPPLEARKEKTRTLAFASRRSQRNLMHDEEEEGGITTTTVPPVSCEKNDVPRSPPRRSFPPSLPFSCRGPSVIAPACNVRHYTGEEVREKRGQ